MTRKGTSSSLDRRNRNNGEQEQQQQNQRELPQELRQRNRAVAEREASRLARPEARRIGRLGHASRKKSAVTSTPSGYVSFQTATSDGGTDASHEEWCGPFSVARRMIAKREEAKRKREEEQEENKEHHPLDQVMDELEMEKKRKAQPSLQWKGSIPDVEVLSNQSYYAKRRKRVQVQVKTSSAVPSLFQLCVDFVVENFEYVEALGNVDSAIRRNICEALVEKKKMNGVAFEVIAEKGIEALELVDCAEVTQDQLAKSLKELLHAGLRYLALQHSGRCFGSKVVQAIIAPAPASSCSLFGLSIGGAYLLKDEDAASLIAATASTLSSIDFTACPLLKSQFCKALSDNHCSSAKGNLLELSLENVAISKDDLLSLATSSDALRNLKSLKLRQIESVDDEVVVAILNAVNGGGGGGGLEAIDLSFNHSLTDDALSAIRQCNKNGALRSLELCELKHMTESGLEAFFTLDIAGLPPPPMLKKLMLNNCHHEAVTDTVMDLATKCSSVNRGAVTESISTIGGLVHVGIHGSSCTDRTMESLAATSAKALKELDVCFCPLISDMGLGYLVSKAHLLSTLHIWGCAQITDEFLDGHCRVGDSSFEIIGAWMKQNRVFSVK